MHYVIADIHNDNKKFEKLLKVLNLSSEDKLFILGDVFDRAGYTPDPVGLYFNILRLGDKCQVIRGNHDQLLAEYIVNYCETREKKRKFLEPYGYNSFDIIANRLTVVDMYDMANNILEWPLQVEVVIEGKKYLMAHAMTDAPGKIHNPRYYLEGEGDSGFFLETGIEGYVSVCGHSNIGGSHIWKNAIGNVIMCDCGCGFGSFGGRHKA